MKLNVTHKQFPVP